MSGKIQPKTQALIFSDFFLPGYKGGGPIKTLSNLIEAITSDDLKFRVVTRDRDLGDKATFKEVTPDKWNETKLGDVYYASPNLFCYLITLFRLRKSFDNVVYFNSFFSPRFTILPLIIFLFSRKEIILAPKGEFSDGALDIKAARKKLVIWVAKIFSIRRRVLFHASTKAEKVDIQRALGRKVNVYIAEDISLFKESRAASWLEIAVPLKIIFLSRIVPIKNLKFALEVLRAQRINVEFHIYGPLEDHDYWTECKKIIDEMPSNVKVKYMGEVNPQDVITTIAGYHLFFLPTKGENFGHVIAESLSAGTPVLISDQTPWINLSQVGVGWDLPLNDKSAFGWVIEKVGTMLNEEYLQMRSCSSSWIQEKLTNNETLERNRTLFLLSPDELKS